MRVIKPIEITSLNMDNSIPQPDPSVGEVEWVAKDSSVQISDNCTDVAISSTHIYTLNEGTSTITKSDLSGAFISSVNIPDGAVSIACNDINLLVMVSNSNTNRQLKWYDLDLAYVRDFELDQYKDGDRITYLDNPVWSQYVWTFNTGSGGVSRYYYTSATSMSKDWSFVIDASGISAMSYDGFNICIVKSGENMVRKYTVQGAVTGESYSLNPPLMETTGIEYSGGTVTAVNGSVNAFIYVNELSIGNYSEGDEVVISDTGLHYVALTDTQDEPSYGASLDVPSWFLIGRTNKYRAFDYVINTKSELQMPGGFYEFTPGGYCTNVALFGLELATRVTVTVREDNASGAIIYSEFQDTAMPTPLVDSIVNDEFLTDKLLFDDLPVYETPHITIEFESGGDAVKVGSIVIGNARELGIVNYQSSTSRTSYDVVKIDDFGNNEVISRPSAEYTSYEVTVPPEYADYVERILKDSLNMACVWVGDKSNDEKLFTLGYYERSPIVYSSSAHYTTTLKIRGLV